MAVSAAKQKARRELMAMIVRKDTLQSKMQSMKSDVQTLTGGIKVKRAQIKKMA